MTFWPDLSSLPKEAIHQHETCRCPLHRWIEPVPDEHWDFCGNYECGWCGECFWCGGEGYVYGEEMGDPLWYDDDEVVTCSSCHGSGRARDMTAW